MHQAAQGLPIDKFHPNEIYTAALADFVDMCDVGVVERRRGFCFLRKSPHPLLIVRKLDRQNLQRNLAIQFGIQREIHLSHPALTNL